MLTRLRRRAAATLASTTFCDSCSEVCTPGCRAEARRNSTMTQVLAFTSLR